MKTSLIAALCALAILSKASGEAPSPGSCPLGYTNATLDQEVTEGPYYVVEDLFRSNVVEDQLGLPLEIRITVLDTDCNPVVEALVDIWNCNATGDYSAFTLDSGGGGNLAPVGARKLLTQVTDNTTFLRGTVATDKNGLAVFYTLVPGWYTGRTTHVHTKIHIIDEASSSLEAEYTDSHVAHTGQFFFTDELLDSVYALYPYSRHTGDRTALTDDGIFQSSGPDNTLLFDINEVQPGNLSAGLIGSVTAVVDPNKNYTNDGFTSDMSTGMGMGPSTVLMGPGQGAGMGMPSSLGAMPGGGMLGGMSGGGMLGGMSGIAGQPPMPSSALPTLTGRKLAHFVQERNNK